MTKLICISLLSVKRIMIKGVKLVMRLFKKSKVILSLAQIIYSARKSTSMNQTFTLSTLRKRERKGSAEDPSVRSRLRVIYEASMLISRSSLYPEKQSVR